MTKQQLAASMLAKMARDARRDTMADIAELRKQAEKQFEEHHKCK